MKNAKTTFKKQLTNSDTCTCIVVMVAMATRTTSTTNIAAPVAELSDLVILVRNKRQITDDKNVKKERKTELTTHKVDERHIHDRCSLQFKLWLTSFKSLCSDIRTVVILIHNSCFCAAHLKI